MKHPYSYCEYCKKDVHYNIIQKQSVITMKEMELSFKEQIAQCKYCHHEIFVMDLMDRNIEATSQLYYKKQSKIYAVASYLLRQKVDITPLVLQKALYYSQGFFYAFHHMFLFPDDAQAWVHGPVYKDIYHAYQKDQEQFFRYVPKLTKEEQEILDVILRYICCYKGEVLTQLTHLEQPWLQARKDLSRNTKTDRVIKKDKIAAYFETIKRRYAMKQPCDIRLYAKDSMNKIQCS